MNCDRARLKFSFALQISKASMTTIRKTIIAVAVLMMSCSLGCENAGDLKKQALASEARAREAEAKASEAHAMAAASEARANEALAKVEEAESSIKKMQASIDRAKLRTERSAEAKSTSPNIETIKTPPAIAPANQKSLNARMFSWNVESEGSDPNVIAQQLPTFGTYDIYALTEVLKESFDLFRVAAGNHFESIDSKTGNNDRMQIIYNAERFELLRRIELHDINYKRRYRSPLAAHLRDKTSGTQFIVMVNHLARGKAEIRAEQATQLVAWARDQNLPVIALGDYNFDYVFASKKGNEGMVNMMRDNVWRWIEPSEMIDTNWFDNPREPDGKDDYPGSMLDFAFVSGAAKEWKAVCNVLVRDGDFPDDKTTSDHRPFELIIGE